MKSRILPGLVLATIVFGAIALAEDPRAAVARVTTELRHQQAKAHKLEEALEAERHKAYDAAQRLEAAGVWCYEACATQDVTADVSADEFLTAVDCAWDCQDYPLCNGPMSSDDTLEILLTTCGLGWFQAQELMFESQANYERCARELSYYQGEDAAYRVRMAALMRASDGFDP